MNGSRPGDATPAERIEHSGLAVPASRGDMIHLFEHLEDELLKSGFLYPPDKVARCGSICGPCSTGPI